MSSTEQLQKAYSRIVASGLSQQEKDELRALLITENVPPVINLGDDQPSDTILRRILVIRTGSEAVDSRASAADPRCDKLEEILSEINSLKDALKSQEIRNLREKLDCWHSNARTRVESQDFKNSLATFYNCVVPDANQLKCMITGLSFPRDEVRASHLVKQFTQGDTMNLHVYGLPPDIDHPRNGLLLLNPIEEAFDRKDICFLWDPVNLVITMKVLNPTLATRHVDSSSSLTFASIDGRQLILPSGVFPFRRVLSLHAKLAFSRALFKEWVADTENFDSYFCISDNGLSEPLGIGHLTWQEVHREVHCLGL